LGHLFLLTCFSEGSPFFIIYPALASFLLGDRHQPILLIVIAGISDRHQPESLIDINQNL